MYRPIRLRLVARVLGFVLALKTQIRISFFGLRVVALGFNSGLVVFFVLGLSWIWVKPIFEVWCLVVWIWTYCIICFAH